MNVLEEYENWTREDLANKIMELKEQLEQKEFRMKSSMSDLFKKEEKVMSATLVTDRHPEFDGEVLIKAEVFIYEDSYVEGELSFTPKDGKSILYREHGSLVEADDIQRSITEKFINICIHNPYEMMEV